MPSAPSYPCRHPGCAALVDDRTGYCAKHQGDVGSARQRYEQTTRRNDPALAWAAGVRSSVRWQKVRTIHKAIEPLCCDPFGEHRNDPYLNEESHHIIPLVTCYSTFQELAYTLSNLAGLCVPCHARVGALERKGKPTAQLFLRSTADATQAPQ
jgi:5-methylcytosine-specific restriction endonuclease McrA